MADPKGKEFRVNTYTLDRQEAPAIAMDAAGNFVVTWDLKQDGSSRGIDRGVYAQRYTKNGKAVGAEFRVNTTIDKSQAEPDIAMAPGGNFVVVWEGYGNDPSKGKNADSDRGIFAQRYNSAGVRLGAEFQINTTIAKAQDNPKVAIDAKGNFVTVWGSDSTGINYNLYAQRFNAQGMAQGGEFLVATTRIAGGTQADVAMDAKGNFVVTWAKQGVNDPENSVWAKRYDRNGDVLGKAFLVDSFDRGGSGKPAVDMNAAGNFVVSWYGGDGDIFARRYNHLGASQGGTRLVTSSGNNPDVVLGTDGDFVVTWTARNGIKARHFDKNNTPQSADQVSTTRANPFEPGAIAIDDAGNYTVAWQGSVDRDDNIYAQRFAETGNSNNIKGTASADQLRGTNGNDMLTGLGGNDQLVGNSGNDQLLGGVGRDVLIGGLGADRFVLQDNAGVDKIQDFENNQDKLVLSGSLTFGALNFTQIGNTTLISQETTVLAQLTGVSATQLNAADFILQ